MTLTVRDPDKRLNKVALNLIKKTGLKSISEIIEYSMFFTLRNTTITDEEIKKINDDYIQKELNKNINRQAHINYVYSNVRKSLYKQLANTEVSLKDIEMSFKELIQNTINTLQSKEIKTRYLFLLDEITPKKLYLIRKALRYLISKRTFTQQMLNKLPLETIDYEIKKTQQTGSITKKEYKQILDEEIQQKYKKVQNV